MATTVEIKILIKGKVLSNFTSLSIRQDILTQHTFEVVCRPDSFEKFSSFGESFVIDKSKDLIGEKIKVEVTPIGKDNVKAKSTVIFNGIILEVQGEKYRDAVSGSIMLRGASMDALMDGDRHCRSFENTTLDTIVHVVTNDYSSNLFDKMLVASKYKESIEYIVQYNESNLDFLARLAKTYGEWMLVTGENHFYFGELPGARASLLHGKDLHEFSFSMKLSTLGFNYTDYNYYEEESIQKESKAVQPQSDSYLSDAVSGSDGLFTQEEDIHFNIPLSKKNAEKELEAAVKTDKSARVAGLSSARGSSDNCELVLGGIVKIESSSNVNNNKKTLNYGEYRIISLYHSCDESGNYLNHFEAVPVKVEVPPQSNPNYHPVCETQGAVVTDTDDPEGIGRIRVRFFWQDNKGQSPWIRVLTAYAGDNKGMFFIPEVGEEVLIGFENQNAEKPFVIGALYNGKKRPDDWKSNKNYKKAIRTSSGHTIEFNDEGGTEEIVIYDHDKINTITLSSNGKLMTISCQGDLKIKAENIDITANKDYNLDVKGMIKISSGKDTEIDASSNCKISTNQNMELNASQNMELKASQNIDIKASAGLKASGSTSAEISGATFKAKGSATAELSAGGQTVVKGGIVMIN